MTNFLHHIRSSLHHIIKIPGTDDISTSFLPIPMAERRFRNLAFQTHQSLQNSLLFIRAYLTKCMYDYSIVHVERIPGERMYIDWGDNQPELLTDPATREICKVHVFATTLGFISRVYTEIFPYDKLPSFIASVVHALECYGAVPKYLVPNNLNTAVSKHSKYELILNSAFHLCSYKGTGHNCD